MPNFSSGLSEFEQKLLNAGYKQLEPFYLLKEGEIFDERNGGTQKITKSRLEEIAATQNARVTDSNDATPIIIGHTKRNLPEKSQPPIVGLAPRWEVVKFFKTNKWALQAIPWAKNSKVKLEDDEEITCEEAFDRFPRRSAEFWTDPDVLDPISLLGANTPRLDLGLHRLQQDRQSIQLGQHYTPRKPIILEMDMPADTLAPATPDATAGANMASSDEFQQLKAQVAKFTEIADLLEPFLQELRQAQQPGGDMGGAPPPGGPPGAPPAGAMPPPSPETGGGGGGDDDDDDEPVQAAMAIPAGSNTVMPQHLDRQPAQRSTRTGDPRDKVIEQLQLQVASLQLQRIEDVVNTHLDELEDKVVFNREKEFKRMVQLSKQDLDDHVAYMQSTYKEKDEPLPEPPVPLHMHKRQDNQATAAGAGPITLQQAHDMLGMPADPALAASPQKSRYDQLTDIVRNRGKNGKPLMAAYEEIMGKAQGTGDVTPIR